MRGTLSWFANSIGSGTYGSEEGVFFLFPFLTLKQHVSTFATYEAEVQFEHGMSGGASELIKDGTGVLVVLSRYTL